METVWKFLNSLHINFLSSDANSQTRRLLWCIHMNTQSPSLFLCSFLPVFSYLPIFTYFRHQDDRIALKCGHGEGWNRSAGWREKAMMKWMKRERESYVGVYMQCKLRQRVTNDCKVESSDQCIHSTVFQVLWWRKWNHD